MARTFTTPSRGVITIEASPARGHVWAKHEHPDGQCVITPIPLHLARDVALAIVQTVQDIEDGILRPELPTAYTVSHGQLQVKP